jgi:signal transduction histidine kinase
VHQILHEYELLGGILVAFVKEEMVSLGLRPEPVECLELVNRIRNAVGLLLRATVDAFLSQYLDTISVQGRNLESFHRTLSHELRQPLTTVQGAVQLLQTYPAARTGEKLDHTLETLARNIERIIHITRQLERLARAETERDNPSTQVVNLSHVATDVARQLREMAEARGVVVRIAPDLPSITVDAGRIELVFTNLISNAIKYSDPAKEQRVVEVRRAEAPEDVCAITVSDNGIGIPADRVDRIFDQFVRAHRGRDEELGVHGMGLGLSIVWESVMAIGGSITVASAESEGTVFTVMLPNECLA